MTTYEDFTALVKENRSCRRFDNARRITMDELKDLVDLARHCASAANNQPLKFILSTDEQTNKDIFSCLGWAAYLTDWPGPKPVEQPSAYIVITGDHTISDKFWCDHGIAAQTILLGARAKGLAGCMFGAINIKKLKEFLDMCKSHIMVLIVIQIIMAFASCMITAKAGQVTG
ncbi:MAG: nitroreductase family protein [Desulfobacteraceae bacterium]|nr:nitroreductase family protein [Desulfobacteraceae bacterium]